MEKLFERICLKCVEGLPYHEAVQFALWIYCTLDVLPIEFRGLALSRKEICRLFSRLGSVGKIIVESSALPERGQLSDAFLNKPEHWDNLIMQFLKREITLDDSFPVRIGRYV